MARIAVIGLVGKSMFFDVPRFHVGGETITAKSLHEEWGGKGFNQAVAAARQDAAVTFLGAVCAADARSIGDFCAKEGVRATLASKRKPTACAAIMTDGTGETRVTVCPGAELSPGDVDGFAGAIATADVLLLNNEVPEGGGSCRRRSSRLFRSSRPTSSRKRACSGICRAEAQMRERRDLKS